MDIQDRLKEELQSGISKEENEDLYPVLSEEIKRGDRKVREKQKYLFLENIP